MSFRIFKEFFDHKRLHPKAVESNIFDNEEVPEVLRQSLKSEDDEIETFYETETFTQTETQNEMKFEGKK